MRHTVSEVAGSGSSRTARALWLVHRSHADLGTNWSVTQQVRENHRLIVTGVYPRVRPPMYAALFLYSVGQVLMLPLRAEERLMLEEFGADYAAYMAKTERPIPGFW